MTGSDALSVIGADPAEQLPITQSKTLGQDDFLKLFLAKLQAQDPLNPMDDAEFTAQLAMFSQIEQLITTNDQLAMLQLLGNTSNNAQMVSFIGKEVKAGGNTFELIANDGIQEVEIPFELAGEANDVFVSVYNSDGAIVRVLDNAGPLGSGEQSALFNGRDDHGNVLSDGLYSFTVSAKDVNGEAVPAKTLIRGMIDGVTYEGTETMLMIGSIHLSINDILRMGKGQEGDVG